ncbi:MAG: ATP-dependent zinc metalloprotease FtsH [Bacteroidales bacterium]|nr:ATP-dependent zinc metalloprotease FtsH [Bacteroidales bacterium]MBR6175326.1 ATP-dependent zinc metalloprotease FtsH [Bacteroidales bacterium]
MRSNNVNDNNKGKNIPDFLGGKNGQNGQNGQNGGKKKFNWSIFYLLVTLVLVGIYFFSSGGAIKEVNDMEFYQMVKNQDIEHVEFVKKNSHINIFLKKEALEHNAVHNDVKENTTGPQYYLVVTDLQVYNENLRDAKSQYVAERLAQDSTLVASEVAKEYDFPMKQDNSQNWGFELLIWVFPLLLIFMLYFFSMRQMRNGGGPFGGAGNIFNIGKSRAQEFDEKTGQVVTFKDVAGLEGAKFEIEEVVDFLKNPEKYTVLGGKIPKGVLLVGPPGTGKTLLAKAVAGEAKVPFFSMSGSDFVEMFVGVGASRVRDLFRNAKEKAPCIIFIDEIDAIGRARGKGAFSNANDERESTLNQLLTEMDGFGTNAGVIIMAATNRADILDRALLRAGRFDRQIQVELPNLNERKGIFGVHVRNLKLGPDVDLDFFAKQTPGFSGADIANVCNEAALIAARQGKKQVEKVDFLSAVDRIIGGLERRGSVISPEEKKTIAYHESGHACVSWMLRYASPLVKVTIVPRGKALGAAWYLPEERQLTTYEQLFDEMAATLGGRAAEEVFFGRISTGALNDLERVSKQAYAMVVYYGLDEKIGNVSYYDSTGQQEYSMTKPYSEKTAEEIDERVHLLIEKAYACAKKILTDHYDNVETLAKLLLEREVIFTEDVERILGPRPFAPAERIPETASDAEIKPAEEASESTNPEA